MPRWAWPVLLAVLVAAVWPSVRRNTRTEEARKLFRTATRLAYAARIAQEDAAVARVAGHALGLVAIADLALAEGRPRVVPGVLDQLRALGGATEHVRRIEAALEGPQPQSAMEAAIIVERLRAQGQADEAARRLDRALRRWPADPELTALAAPRDGS